MQIQIPQGATLSGLAAQYKTTVPDLLKLNTHITNPNLIQAGANLNLPDQPLPQVQQPQQQQNQVGPQEGGGSYNPAGTGLPQQQQQVQQPEGYTRDAQGNVFDASGNHVDYDSLNKNPDGSPVMNLETLPQKQNVLYDLTQKYGLDFKGLVDSFNKQPTQTAEEMYKALYDQHGLGDIQKKVDSATEQLKEINDQYTQKIGDINNDPWLATNVRNSKINLLDRDYNLAKQNAVSLLTLYTNQYDREQTNLRELVTSSLNEAHQNRQFSLDELGKYLDRAQKDSEATQKLTQADEKLNAPIKVSGGTTLYDPKTGKPIYTAPKLANPKVVSPKNSSPKKTFTTAQINKAAAFSNMSIEEFSKLPDDTKNAFINPVGLNTKLKEIGAAIKQGVEPSKMINDVQQQNIPKEAKDFLIKHIRSSTQ